MRRKRYTAYFLCLVSILMLIVPVVPHHHHADGIICMKNDLHSDGCEHSEEPCANHCCCDNGCVTERFFHQASSTDGIGAQFCLVRTVDLFTVPLFKLPALSDANLTQRRFVYAESLHGTLITHATGLRAPPRVLA